MTKQGILKERVGDGAARDIVDAVLDALRDDTPVSDAVLDVLTDKVIERYSNKIGALFRRAGIDVEDGELFTPERLGQIFEEQTGIPVGSIGELNSEMVLQAIDRDISQKLSEELGFQIGSVFDGDALVLALQDGIEAKIEALEGNIDKYLDVATIRNLRRKATWARSGLDPKTVQNCLAQRAYRRSNKWVYF